MQAAGPQCPKCGTTLKDDYGMVTCESCGTILLVDMDGAVHVESDQEAQSPTDIGVPQEEAPAPADPVIPEWPVEPSADFATEPAPGPTFEGSDWETPQSPTEGEAPESGFDLGSLANLDPMTEPTPDAMTEPQTSDFGQDFASVPEAEPVSIPNESVPEQNPEEFNMDALLGYQEPEQNPDGGGDFIEGGDLAPAGDPLGLNEYANSEISQAKDGMLVFKLLISGIDSKEIRESIREAMEDARFGWDVNSIIGQINKGDLTIENLSPVKATILINRIKRLPIQIRWEQYAITQIDEGGTF